MTTSRTTAVVLFCSVVSLALPARPQQTKPAASTQTAAPAQQSKSTAVHATQDKRQILVKSGTLSLLSSSEADLVTGDAAGHPVTLTFLCDQNTKEDRPPRATLSISSTSLTATATSPSSFISFSPPVIRRAVQVRSAVSRKSSQPEPQEVPARSVESPAPALRLPPTRSPPLRLSPCKRSSKEISALRSRTAIPSQPTAVSSL